MKKMIAAILVSSLAAGCSTPQQSAALECGAAGVGGGYLLCKLMGGSDQSCAQISVVAGIGGSAICYSYAGKYERHRQELAGRENDLDARLRYVRELNADSARLNSELSTRVAQIERHTDQVVAQISQGRISQQQLAKEREALANEEKSANNQVALEQRALDDMKRFQAENARKAGAENDALDREIRRQEQLLADTQRHTTALASQRQRI